MVIGWRGTGLDQVALLDFDNVVHGSRALVREKVEGVTTRMPVQWMGALALTVVGQWWTVMNGWHPLPFVVAAILVALVMQQGDADHPLAHRW